MRGSATIPGVPGVTISVHCLSCDWQADVSEGGYGCDAEGLPVMVEPKLCLSCREVVSVERPHARTFDEQNPTLKCPRCESEALTAWPGRDEDLLLERASQAGKLGTCPRCSGRVAGSGVVTLWD